MTHKDIYTKFMIEYDKANVTSSYPSLTEYEVATVLDKAYHALIAQKVTGNNVRRSTFESDVKSIADLGPLTTSQNIKLESAAEASNVSKASIPNNLLYFLLGYMEYSDGGQYTDSKGLLHNSIASFSQEYAPLDGKTTRKLPFKLVNHEVAMKFFSSAYNMPWIKTPVCYIENETVYVVYDPLNVPVTTGDKKFHITYIKVPNLFVKNLANPSNTEQLSGELPDGYFSYFDYEKTFDNYIFENVDGNNISFKNRYEFECTGTVAEELISLAVAFALENVESSRLNSKLNMRGLEA